MCKPALDSYSYMPEEMRAYMRNYGFSFSKRACEWAVNRMYKENPSTKKREKIEPWTKEQVDDLLKKYNVTIENNIGYNYVYVANKLKADKLKSSIPDEQHLALGVKDEIDDIDDIPENIFRCYIYSLEGKGIPVPWEDWL